MMRNTAFQAMLLLVDQPRFLRLVAAVKCQGKEHTTLDKFQLVVKPNMIK
jgi:hypothetical protein